LIPARDWWQDGLTWRTALVLPVAWIFGLLVRCRHALYRAGWFSQVRLRVPVLVVGNITVGGSGKTPLVIHLVDALRQRGHSPGVISRGYGATDAPALGEVTPTTAPAQCGDEPTLIRRRAGCPVFVGARRAAAGQALLDAYPQVDVIIADDGLQHLALARDYEIAVFDGRGCGNGRLLPAGPLREPLARLREVDAVVDQDAGAPVDGAFAMALVPEDFHALDQPGHTCPPALFAERESRTVAAVAGIGNPSRFFRQLRALGLTVEEHAFPDHHTFSASDIAGIHAPIILMTEKDALKCAGFGDGRIWVAPVRATVGDELVDSILEKLFGSQTA
jgi:tetraacyldisaccharide 4'-kinase